jgi:protein gp37
MSKSSIEWTDSTWNPTTGCTKISKECDNCYAEKLTNRYMHNSKQPKYKSGFNVVVEHDSSLQEPATWNGPLTVFVNSMSDLFHKDVSLDFIKKVFKTMNDTPSVTYQVLTKRHDKLKGYSSQLTWTDNIWMGVSVGNKVAIRRIKSLVSCGAKHKFLSIEPLLEDLGDFSLKGIDLVFVGGESGPKCRPMKKEWVLKIKDNCIKQNVAFFFKQWGDDKNNPDKNDPTINKLHTYHAKGGSLLDGELYLKNPSVTRNPVQKIALFGKDYYVMDNFEDLLTIWELKTYLPLMEDELFAQLKDDIKKNGINDPILFYKTKDGSKLVIEGHTRLSAAIKLRIKDIPSKEIQEHFTCLEDIKLWMVKHQFQRRNLSSVERIKLAMLSKETIEQMARDNLSKAGKQEKINNTIDTNAEIAKIAGVGRSTVVRYTSVFKEGSELIKKKLNKGEITISTAYQSLKKSNAEPRKVETKIDNEASEKYVTLNSISQGKLQIKEGIIDYFIVTKKDKTKKISKYLSPKAGLCLID